MSPPRPSDAPQASRLEIAQKERERSRRVVLVYGCEAQSRPARAKIEGKAEAGGEGGGESKGEGKGEQGKGEGKGEAGGLRVSWYVRVVSAAELDLKADLDAAESNPLGTRSISTRAAAGAAVGLQEASAHLSKPLVGKGIVDGSGRGDSLLDGVIINATPAANTAPDEVHLPQPNHERLGFSHSRDVAANGGGSVSCDMFLNWGAAHGMVSRH